MPNPLILHLFNKKIIPVFVKKSTGLRQIYFFLPSIWIKKISEIETFENLIVKSLHE